MQWIQAKKIEVTRYVLRAIEQIRHVENEFHTKLDDFKVSRLASLRSAPAELKETNVNLMQFVTKTLEDMEK